MAKKKTVKKTMTDQETTQTEQEPKPPEPKSPPRNQGKGKCRYCGAPVRWIGDCYKCMGPRPHKYN